MSEIKRTPTPLSSPCKACGTVDRRPNGRCRPCSEANEKAWKSANKEKVRKASREWSKTNRTKCNEKGKTWRAANPEAFKAAKRKWLAKPGNKEKTRVAEIDWRERNRATKRLHWLRWKKRNPEGARAIRARVRAKRYGAEGQHSAEEWKTLFDSYGGLCVYCAAPATTRDHVVPLARGGTDSIENIAPACLSCNARKGSHGMLAFMARRAA